MDALVPVKLYCYMYDRLNILFRIYCCSVHRILFLPIVFGRKIHDLRLTISSTSSQNRSRIARELLGINLRRATIKKRER